MLKAKVLIAFIGFNFEYQTLKAAIGAFNIPL